MRFLFRTPGAEARVMHVARFTEAGEMTWTALCGRGGFNRSINAPWGLGRPRCKDCLRRLETPRTFSARVARYPKSSRVAGLLPEEPR